MIHPHAQAGLSPVASMRHRVILWSAIAVLLGAFYSIEHSIVQVSASQAYTLVGDELADRVAEGDASRRIVISGLAVFGLVLFLIPRREARRSQLIGLQWLLIGYFLWCGLSVLWSDDPSLTLRRFSVLVFCSVGAIGLAKQLSLNDLCFVALMVTGVLIANSVRTEIMLGTFQPWTADYRFSGTLHPNAQAPYCGALAVAAGFLATSANRYRLLLWTICLTAVVLLVLTKSRTVCAAFLGSMFVYHSIGLPGRNKLLAAVAVAWAASTLLWIAALAGMDVERHLTQAVLIGRSEDLDSFSGRLPLWAALLPYIQQHPVLGHGYQAFWNFSRIESFSHTFEWTIPNGHSSYLDGLLDLGIVGMALCALTMFNGVRESVRHLRTRREIGLGFIFVMLVAQSFNSIAESGLATPTSFVFFLTVWGLLRLGFVRQPTEAFVAVQVPTMAYS